MSTGPGTRQSASGPLLHSSLTAIRLSYFMLVHSNTSVHLERSKSSLLAFPPSIGLIQILLK